LLSYIYRFTLSILLLLPTGSFAQALLQQRMNLSVANQPIKEVLNQLEQEGNFFFSYNSNIIDEQKKVSLNVQGKTLAQILHLLFEDQYKFQSTEKHIIILPATQNGIIVVGRLIEANSGAPIEFASIYERSLSAGTMSDAQGNFKLQIKQAKKEYELVISKLSYKDTILKINSDLSLKSAITLEKHSEEMDEFVVTDIQKHWLAKRLINTKEKINAINLKGYFAKQQYQFSILPGLGSKNLMKSQTINKFSFNLIGGYTAGVRGFELGSGFNIVQQNMEHVQVGGLFNIVGGYSKGVQLSGVYNYVAKNSKGVQLSGIYNNSHSLNGIQATGGVNWTRQNVVGIQMAGFANRSNALDGLQFSGAANINKTKTDGGQTAGIINISDSMEGAQIAGFINKSKQSKGLQLAGGINISSERHKGAQIAGLVNYAKRLDGFQLGLFNLADTTSGLSFGLINIILKGKHSIDIASNDFQPIQIAYKSGNEKLYNIFQVGGDFRPNEKLLSIGYGFGLGTALDQNWQLNQEVTVNTLHTGDWNNQNFIGRYDLMLQYKLLNKLKIYAGPSLNLFIHENDKTYDGFKNLFEKRFASAKINSWSHVWLGWTAGISLF
jgi:hypothetical protein